MYQGPTKKDLEEENVKLKLELSEKTAGEHSILHELTIVCSDV